jgi:hypothetical protein
VKNETFNASLSARIDSMKYDIQALLETGLHGTNRGSTASIESQLLLNLEECVQSTGRVISGAETIIAASQYGGSDTRSVMGAGLTVQRRLNIEDWIPAIPEEPIAGESARPEGIIHIEPVRQLSAFETNVELELDRGLAKLAKENIRLHKYKDAEAATEYPRSFDKSCSASLG